MTEKCLIVAIGENGLIGTKEGGLPWKSAEDFKFFRDTTQNWPTIFGENTYGCMPVTPLPNRLNMVVSLGAKDAINQKGNLVFGQIESALDFVKNFSKAFICGGRMVYKYALENDLVDKVYLTEVMGKFDGDVYFPIPEFPKWLENNGWKIESDETSGSANPPVRFTTWTKQR